MTSETLFLIGFIVIVVIGLVVSSILMFKQIREEIKSNKEKQQYIDSIKPGDVFDWDNRDIRPYINPFDEIDNPYDYLRTTIIDIKTNEAGVKWVKYHYTRFGSDGLQFTDKLEDYLRYRYRISEAE